jgi:hypothetical protein
MTLSPKQIKNKIATIKIKYEKLQQQKIDVQEN